MDLADRYGFESRVADPHYSAHLARLIASAYRGKPVENTIAVLVRVGEHAMVC